MIRKFVKKISLFVAALAVCTSFVSSATYAAVKETTTSAAATVSNIAPVQVVTNYLEAIKNHDADTAVSTLKEVGVSASKQKEGLNKLLDDPDTQITEVKDVTLENETSDTATLSATVEYGDGSIIKTPVSLQKDNGEYKFKRIEVNPDVIRQATKTSTDKSKSLKAYSQRKVIDFDMKEEAGRTEYSDDTFTDYDADYVKVNVATNASIEAWIVQYGYVSDTILTDSETTDSDWNFKLNLKSGKTFKNACLKVRFSTGGYAYGEVYTVD